LEYKRYTKNNKTIISESAAVIRKLIPITKMLIYY